MFDGLVNNYRPSYPSDRNTHIPSIKIDHNLNARTKLTFSYQRTATLTKYSLVFGEADGLPEPITKARANNIVTNIERLASITASHRLCCCIWGPGS